MINDEGETVDLYIPRKWYTACFPWQCRLLADAARAAPAVIDTG